MNNEILRPLVAIGVGFCFGASLFLIQYIRNREILPPQKKEKLIQEDKKDNCGSGSCCQSKPQDDIPQSCKDATLLSCADEGACGDSNKIVPSSGCGTGAGCGTGTGCGTSVNISSNTRKVESISFLYASRTGTAEKFTNEVLDYISTFNPGMPIEKINVNDSDIQTIEALFTEKAKNKLYVMVIASYPDDEFCENLKAYFEESAVDWRVGKGHLQKAAGMIPIMMGDSTYGADYFCQPGIGVAKNFSAIGGARSAHYQIDNLNEKPGKYFKEICQLIDETISYGQIEEPIDDGCGNQDEEEILDEEIDTGNSCSKGSNVDLEDLGDFVKPKNEVRPNRTRVPKEMISDKLRTALTKQGYHLVGSHSGVKICRWTKNQLRGRGGCYKHSFYGIESHRCMEATPSLACANKCVFCWRHHTNPVGTEWRWVTDEPKMLVDAMLEGHKSMVKQLRGVPGVTDAKMVEAMNPVHCALSLVGEPIMYPRIGEFLDYLHDHGISSYLVTNAQFPDAIKSLPPVTQLYASIDAATQSELKAIDRPLHKDFWERFQASLRYMKDVCGRTVYRLTLVAGFNLSDVEPYADLVRIADPDFIEVKGVTYCGTSNNAELSMKNVPWHDQVVEFCIELAALLPEYDVACEHEHSNCVLISHHRFKTENGWKTWIDYPKFQQLYEEYQESGTKFSGLDYSVETPDWAVYGAEERGFDPKMKRHFRNKKSRTVPPGSNGPV